MTNIERPLRTTPRIFDDDRDIYEKAYLEGNMLIQASVTLDTQLDELQRRVYSIKDGKIDVPLEEVADAERDFSMIFDQAVLTLNKSNEGGVGTWNDFFRLKMQIDMIPERFHSQLAFMQYYEFDLRRELANGAAGKNVNVTSYALRLYDDLNENYSTTDQTVLNALAKEKNQLKGALSESVIMALANYSQSPSKLAIPARTYGDLRNKTDMIYLYADDKKKQSFAVPVQIKTTRSILQTPARIRSISPDNGFTLFMSDYDDSDDFRLARLLVAQHEPRDLSADDEQFIIDARNKFDMDIKNKRQENPGMPLPVLERVQKR